MTSFDASSTAAKTLKISIKKQVDSPYRDELSQILLESRRIHVIRQTASQRLQSRQKDHKITLLEPMLRLERNQAPIGPNPPLNIYFKALFAHRSR